MYLDIMNSDQVIMNLEMLLVLFTGLADTTVLSSQDVQHIEQGGALVINADTPPPPDSSILWKVNADKVVEYDKDYPDQGITAYGTFKDRVTLDRTTAELKVTSLTNADNGVYSVEYDSKPQPKSFKVSVFNKLNLTWGGELVIKADTPPPPGSSILWRSNANKVVLYDKDYPSLGIIPYGAFKDRVTLDRTTGELKVTSLTNADNGVYSVKYDNKLQPKTFPVSVFKNVPKPTITHSCNENLTSCTLTCVGDTTDTGVVTCSWKKDREPLTISEQTMQITSKEPANFTCQFCNSMSEEESEPLKNPLHQSLRRVRFMIPYLPRPFGVTTNYTHSTPRRLLHELC